MKTYKTIKYEYSEDYQILEFDEALNGIFDFEVCLLKVSLLVEVIRQIHPKYVIVTNSRIPGLDLLYPIGYRLFIKPVKEAEVLNVFFLVTEKKIHFLQKSKMFRLNPWIKLFTSYDDIYNYIVNHHSTALNGIH